MVKKTRKTTPAFQEKTENAQTGKDNGFIFVVFILLTGRSFGIKQAETLTKSLKAYLKGELNERVAEFTKLDPIFQIRQGLINKVKSFNFQNLGLPQLKMEIKSGSPSKSTQPKKGKNQEPQKDKTHPTSKGVVDLEGMTMEQFEDTYDYFKNDIMGFTYILNKQGRKTGKAILTFGSTVAPLKIVGELFSKNIAPLLYNIIRCTACQKYGHIAKNCRSKFFACAYCAFPHPTSACQVRHQKWLHAYANCSGHHPAFYQMCPTYMKYKNLIDSKNKKVKTEWEERIRQTQAAQVTAAPAATVSQVNNGIQTHTPSAPQSVIKTDMQEKGNTLVNKSTLAAILHTLLHPTNLTVLQSMDEKERNNTINRIIENPSEYQKKDEVMDCTSTCSPKSQPPRYQN